VAGFNLKAFVIPSVARKLLFSSWQGKAGSSLRSE
jgi:hypothetical protein